MSILIIDYLHDYFVNFRRLKELSLQLKNAEDDSEKIEYINI